MPLPCLRLSGLRAVEGAEAHASSCPAWYARIVLVTQLARRETCFWTRNGAPDASFNGGSALFFTQSFFDADSLPTHMSIDEYGRALLGTSRVVARIWL